MKVFIASLIFLLSLNLYAQDVEVLVRVPKHMTSQVPSFVKDHFRHDYYDVGYISKETLRSLSEEVKTHMQILEQDVWAQGRYDIETLAVAPMDKDIDMYHNYEALTNVLKQLAQENPDIVSLRSAGKSVQGRELWYVILSDNASIKEQEPITSYIANMHGDETAGREVMIELTLNLVNRYKAGDARIQNILNHSQVLIMPTMNPDGFELRRRGNANNIDLNRNFDDPVTGLSRNPQIEMKAVVNLHKAYYPTLGLNFHGGTVCFNMPWDHKANRPVSFADDAIITELAMEYASLNSTMIRSREFENGITYGFEWYQVTGGLQDWSILYADSIHATVELSHAKWPNARDLQAVYIENEAALLHTLEKGLFGVHLEVVDSQGNAINNFSVRTSDSPRWMSNKGTHFVHRLSVDRMQKVEIQANGITKSFQVEPKAFDGNFIRLSL